MSGSQSNARQPVCKKYLAGKCAGKNCKYFHPRNINEINPRQEPNKNKRQSTENYEIKYIPYAEYYKIQMDNLIAKYASGNQTSNSTPNYNPPSPDTYMQPEPVSPVTYMQPEPVSPVTYMQPEPVSPVTYMQPGQPRFGIIHMDNQPVHENVPETGIDTQEIDHQEPITFGKLLAKHRIITKHVFDKKEFITWLDDTLPGVAKPSLTVDLLIKITKQTRIHVLQYAIEANCQIHEISMLFVHAKTNLDWLKELQIRFLDVTSYDGIKSFTMSRVKELLTFTLVQLFIKSKTADFKDIDKLVALYVCIMHIITKKKLLIEIEDYDVIVSKYATNTYDMWYDTSVDSKSAF